jgi:radical SAM superfamily enzyme YgiQ (UPF0313 family)
MRVLLLSTYELGRQPFGLASPAAWLEAAGASVACLDLSIQKLEPGLVRQADLIAIHLPMHTATRMAVQVLDKVKILNPKAHLCCYGLYAPLNAAHLKKMGVRTVLGGEFEEDLVQLVKGLTAGAPAEKCSSTATLTFLRKQQFLTPQRAGLPPLDRYAHLEFGNGEQRVVGYTEASRGCKHLCRHCPVVPIYQGQFRIVQREVVLSDLRNQVEAGARHITFGDPDFFNGIGHAVGIVTELHRLHPSVSYDVTIKIQHLLQYSDHLKTLKETGCVFITSAVESLDDNVLRLLDKGHTRSDFIRVVKLCRESGLALSPTFVTFTPWTTWAGYRDLLSTLVDLDLVENVAPIQLAIRLLIPCGSRLYGLTELKEHWGEFDKAGLSYSWRHSDPSLDELCSRLRTHIKEAEARRQSRREIFSDIWRMAYANQESQNGFLDRMTPLRSRASIPYLNEPWYC